MLIVWKENIVNISATLKVFVDKRVTVYRYWTIPLKVQNSKR